MTTQRILIVDDEAPLRTLLGGQLNRAGFDVLAAGSGPEALAAAVEQRPSAVVLDVMMPGMDGFEVCRRLKADPETASIPVIFLTASAGGDFRRRAFAHGAADFLAKPYQMADLPVYLHAILHPSAPVSDASRVDLRPCHIISFVRAADFPEAASPAIRLAEAIPLCHHRPVTLIDLELPAGSIGARLQLAGGPTIRHLLHDNGEPLTAAAIERVAQRYHAGVQVIPAPFSPPSVDQPEPDVQRLAALLDILTTSGNDVVAHLGQGTGTAALAVLRRSTTIGVVAQGQAAAVEACARLESELATQGIERSRIIPVAVAANTRASAANRTRHQAWLQEPYLRHMAGIAF